MEESGASTPISRDQEIGAALSLFFLSPRISAHPNAWRVNRRQEVLLFAVAVFSVLLRTRLAKPRIITTLHTNGADRLSPVRYVRSGVVAVRESLEI